jgi:hypothetical protein
MNKESHRKMHSLVPVYAALSRIQKLAVEGFQGGLSDKFIDVRTEAEDGMAQLIMVENALVHDTYKRRKYEQANVR